MREGRTDLVPESDVEVARRIERGGGVIPGIGKGVGVGHGVEIEIVGADEAEAIPEIMVARATVIDQRRENILDQVEKNGGVVHKKDQGIRNVGLNLDPKQYMILHSCFQHCFFLVSQFNDLILLVCIIHCTCCTDV